MLEGRTLVTGALFGLGGRGEAPQAQPRRSRTLAVGPRALRCMYDSSYVSRRTPDVCRKFSYVPLHTPQSAHPQQEPNPSTYTKLKAPRGARFSFLCQPPATPTRADHARSNTPRVALQNFVLPVMRPSTNPAQLHVPLAGPLAYARRCHPT